MAHRQCLICNIEVPWIYEIETLPDGTQVIAPWKTPGSRYWLHPLIRFNPNNITGVFCGPICSNKYFEKFYEPISH